MDKTTKTILIIVGVLLGLGVICCVGGFLLLKISGNAAMNAMVVEDSDEALEIANKYVDFDLPAGYSAAGMNMGFFRMIFITENIPEGTLTTKPVIFIAGLPEMDAEGELDSEAVRIQMEGSIMSSMGRNGLVMRKTGSYPGVINGQEVEFMVFEGEDENGTQMKAIVSDIFEGKQGSVMVYIMGNASGWDQAMIDQFIDSIR